MNLFSAYVGRNLEVSPETHDLLGDWFPLVDRSAEYRAADSWLETRPRRQWPKNHRRFLLSWFKRVRVNYTEEMRAELHVGEGPSDRGLR